MNDSITVVATMTLVFTEPEEGAVSGAGGLFALVSEDIPFDYEEAATILHVSRYLTSHGQGPDSQQNRSVVHLTGIQLSQTSTVSHRACYPFPVMEAQVVDTFTHAGFTAEVYSTELPG